LRYHPVEKPLDRLLWLEKHEKFVERRLNDREAWKLQETSTKQVYLEKNVLKNNVDGHIARTLNK
jgi:hypothetical protein